MVQEELMNFKKMERINLVKWTPLLIIFLGVFLLFILKQAEVAFVCFFFGIVIIIERIWPEKWDSGNNSLAAKQ